MGWYNYSWRNRVKITVDHTKVPNTDQANFPVFVDLGSLPAGFFANVKSDGSDIRVTQSDGTTECPIEVVAIDTTGKTGELHFKAPSLSHTTDTSFYIYFGNASASAYAANATYGSQNVWDSNFMGVYHMQSNGNDSTINARNLTNHNAATFDTGIIQNSADFGTANTNKYLDSGSNMGVTGGAITMATLVKMRTEITTGEQRILSQNDSVNKNFNVMSYQYNGGTIRLNFERDLIGISNVHVYANGALGTTNIHHLVYKYDGTNIEGVIDNVSAGTTGSTGSGSASAGDDFAVSDASLALNAYVDEIRVSNVKRSTDFTSTEYANLTSNSTFLSIGGVESSSKPLFFTQL